MAFSKMPAMPKGKAKTAKPAPKAVYKERLAKPEPDNYPASPPKAKGNKARMKRLKGAAL
jgi:hypothetical protein